LLATTFAANAQVATGVAQSASGSASHSVVNNAISVPTNPTYVTNNTSVTPDHTSSNARVNQNVDAVAPTIYAGTNPCGSGASAGVSVLGVGVSGGVNNELQTCTDRSWFVLMLTASEKLHNEQFAQWGVAVACLNERIASAAPAGMCPHAAIAPVAQAGAPVTVAPAPVVSNVTLASTVTQRVRPEWCGTWTKADGNVARYRAQCQ
jgi:hypothetical protein